MSINSYKLVPVKMFEDLMKNRQPPVETNRSVKSIIEADQNNISNELSTPKYSTPSVPPMVMGDGRDRSTPLWVYEDQSILPNYSQGKKVTDSFESYKNMLDNDTVPEHIKIQLLQFLRDKYDKTRSSYDTVEIEDEEESNYDDYDKILHATLDPMSADKRRRALDIVTVFRNNSNLIRWNPRGEFILPKYVDNSTINLKSLLKILVYVKEGSEQEIESAIDIIKPFYKAIKHHIVNKKILRRLENIHENVTKKYVALNSPKKRKKKKNK